MARVKRGKIPIHRENSHPLPHPLPSKSPVSADSHSHRVRHLLYLITFLLIVLVIFVFFSFPFNIPSEEKQLEVVSLGIDSVSCQWQNTQFVVCETVSWGGSDASSAKGYIPGGESVDTSPSQTTSPFTYCQPVGTDEGYRVARAMLYSSTALVRDIGQGVQCLGIPVAKQPEKKSTLTSFTTTTGFRTYLTSPSSSPKNSGMFTKTFPGKVQSCTFKGTWITDNDQKFNQRNTCHGAVGSFNGFADAQKQYVINDPDLFRWVGLSQASLNPPAQRYDGYSFWMETCDDEYYRSAHVPRYGVSGTITGFGTSTLAFIWNYYDENTKPAVDFSFDLDCKLQLPSA